MSLCNAARLHSTKTKVTILFSVLKFSCSFCTVDRESKIKLTKSLLGPVVWQVRTSPGETARVKVLVPKPETRTQQMVEEEKELLEMAV